MMLIAVAGAILRPVNAARRALYRRGILTGRRLPRPVISVGNIAAGGAGKTPAVIALSQYLSERGLKVAVLTRGYGRTDGTVCGLVTSEDTTKFGDEPVLIKKRAPSVDVIVGANRFNNAVGYLKQYSCDVFILDDGFQHLQIERDVDIVIDIAGARLYRESRSALTDADIIIPRRLRLHVPDELRAKRVFAFAALADNTQFFETLKDAGLTLAGTASFPDHHRYTTRDLEGLARGAESVAADAIVTTEKDAVKIARRDIIPLPAEFVIDAQVLERVLAAIRR